MSILLKSYVSLCELLCLFVLKLILFAIKFPLAQQEEEKLDPCSIGKMMKLSTRFELNCLLLLYGTKDNIEVENNKVAKKNCLDLLDNSIEVGNERIISCSNESNLTLR